MQISGQPVLTGVPLVDCHKSIIYYGLWMITGSEFENKLPVNKSTNKAKKNQESGRKTEP
jgi:hypothetical protein